MKTTQSATYQQLQIVMTTRGCPICHLSQEMVHDYLDGLLYESVNDPGVRAGLIAAQGFCGRHSRELLRFAGMRTGVAILQHAVLQEALRRLPNLALLTQPTLLQKLQERLTLANDQPIQEDRHEVLLEACPACSHEAQIEKRAAQTLVENLVGDLEEPLRRAGGLCFPHIEQALRATQQPATRDLLIQMQRVIWEELATHLQEFIRKQDHRFHHEKITDDERVAVDRSIAILTGEIGKG
jgi:hypothetical protein